MFVNCLQTSVRTHLKGNKGKKQGKGIEVRFWSSREERQSKGSMTHLFFRNPLTNDPCRRVTRIPRSPVINHIDAVGWSVLSALRATRSPRSRFVCLSLIFDFDATMENEFLPWVNSRKWSLSRWCSFMLILKLGFTGCGERLTFSLYFVMAFLR